MAGSPLWSSALGLLFRLPPYRWALARRGPEGLGALPVDPWPGDPAQADRLFRGEWSFGGIVHRLPNGSPWAIPETQAAWRDGLDGFAWLRHFAAAGGDAAKRHARALLRDWIGRHPAPHGAAWRGDLLGRRVLSWLCHAGFLIEGSEPGFEALLLRSLVAQARHLTRAAELAPEGPGRLTAAVGLIAAARSLAGIDRGGRGRRLLERELERQILADGGHVSRNPSILLALLAELVALKLQLARAGDAPVALINAVDRMAPMLRFFRLGDGGLALFNGAGEDDVVAIDRVLELADAEGKPLAAAPHSGYQRLAARRALLLVDSGSGGAHAGALSFELAVGRERIVVNCGDGADAQWREAAAHTAAHSTLVLADTDSAPVGHGRTRSVPVAVERTELDGNLWLDLAHEGYLDQFGLTHRRRLWLSAAGDDLRGEDKLVARPGSEPGPQPFAVRFHLHPDIKASLVQAGVAALLQTGGGHGYRLRVAGGQLALEDSVYLAHRRSRQVVIHGQAQGPETTVKWRLERLQPRPRRHE